MKSRQTLPCGFLEDDFIAVTLGEALATLRQRVETHLRSCSSCTALSSQYHQLWSQLDSLPEVSEEEILGVRRALNARLQFPQHPRLLSALWHSPVGDIRIGKTEKGVALVEFIHQPEEEAVPSRLARKFTVEQGGEDLKALIRSLEEYLTGQRQNLEWVVDEAFMRSDFQREVLRATAEVPYGTVVTYLGIAETIGRPKAVRAVAQALRYNPVPIHIPCHRVIGSDGSLTGYAGNLVGIKKHILAVEGIPVVETTKGLSIAKERMYVGWRHNRWFCRPNCSALKAQSAGDRVFISSCARAEQMGYEPCDKCRPDIYPLA